MFTSLVVGCLRRKRYAVMVHRQIVAPLYAGREQSPMAFLAGGFIDGGECFRQDNGHRHFQGLSAERISPRQVALEAK